MFEFQIKFHFSLFFGIELATTCIGSNNGLMLNMQQAITDTAKIFKLYQTKNAFWRLFRILNMIT